MKKKEKQAGAMSLTADELIKRFSSGKRRTPGKLVVPFLVVCLVIPVVPAVLKLNLNGIHPVSDSGGATFTLAAAPIAATAVKKDLIAIPTGTVKANPFLPYRDISGTSSLQTVSDVPEFDLVDPPEMVNEASDAARVMDTVVSGILYDKYSPSAILNIEGNDYLVKKGDTVNNYKVLSIMQDSVTVMLGNNTYKAGIGEILTEGAMNHNDVSNLSNKFGGERNEK